MGKQQDKNRVRRKGKDKKGSMRRIKMIGMIRKKH